MDWSKFDEAFENCGRPQMPTITRDSVRELRDDTHTRRICFAPYYEYNKYLKSNSVGKYAGAINFPFRHGLEWVYPGKLFRNSQSIRELDVWCSLRTQEEYDEIASWIADQGERVYLRDRLSISIALSLNKREADVYTTIGALERAAKYDRDGAAIRKLAAMCSETIAELKYYCDCKYIVTVPAESGKVFHLPSSVVSIVADQLHLNDLSRGFSNFSKPKLKDRRFEEKWDDWEATELAMETDLTGKDVVLIDDLYQSGTTLQFVAMKLQEAGARNVFGLCLVKSWRDTDNQ